MEKNSKKKFETRELFSKVRIIAPYPFTYTFRVKPHEAGLELASFFYQRFPFRAVNEWESRIQNGLISINEASVPSDYILKPNDVIRHFSPKVIEPSVPDKVEIVFENEDYLLVNKPAPLPVHAGGRYQKNTLLNILNDAGYENLYVVHRLDSVTSGLIIFAKSANKAAQLQSRFLTGQVHKVYHALVAGVPKENEFECLEPVRRDKGFKFTTGEGLGAKSAHTKFKVIDSGFGQSIIECKPITGRTHQIRVHLKALGFPIANDFVYHENQHKQKLQNTSIYLQQTILGISSLGKEFQISIPELWFRILRNED